MKKVLKRCAWVPEGNELYARYHDKEWGVPVRSDRKLFEFIVLESAQAGLSWITVLRKRDAYRKAFKDFDPVKVARFTDRDLERLLKNPGIIRNRAKIKATIVNARAFLKVQKEFGTFSKYLWGFVNNRPIVNRWKTIKQLPPRTALAERLAADMKHRGFSFMGPTVVYAHMQAVGMVNDHTTDCFRYRAVRH